VEVIVSDAQVVFAHFLVNCDSRLIDVVLHNILIRSENVVFSLVFEVVQVNTFIIIVLLDFVRDHVGIIIHIEYIVCISSLHVVIRLNPAIADIHFFDSCCCQFNILDTVLANNLLGNEELLVFG
jgi:hypothetical protein